MSMSLFDDVFKNQKIPVNCPHCNKEITILGGQIGTMITCPHCLNQILLNVANGSVQDIKNEADVLEHTLENLGK